LFLLFSSVCIGNDIDKLQTYKDVYNFLIKKVDKDFKKNPPLDDNLNVADTNKYGRNKFFKIDIDNNGLTDLIIYGYRDFLVVLDKSKNNYIVRYLDSGIFSLNTVTLLSIDTATIPKKIIIQQKEKSVNQIDTLVYSFNGFIEYNDKPISEFTFEKITFKTTRCFGTCPIFEMTINEDKSATYNAIEYNEETGDFKAILPAKEFDELISLLKYLNIDRMQDEYSVNWTDDQTVKTEISYNGKSKIISDYGKIGTFGLRILYSKLFGLRKVIEWRE
jgi:Domain of unknown function (DUF6438)